MAVRDGVLTEHLAIAGSGSVMVGLAVHLWSECVMPGGMVAKHLLKKLSIAGRDLETEDRGGLSPSVVCTI